MSTEATRPCMYCGKKLPAEANFCMACGKSQESEPAPESEASRAFALVEDDAPAAPEAKAPPAPRPAEPEPPGTIELEDEGEAPAAAKEEEEEPPESEETGAKTMRMPLSDVVQAWAEDAPAAPTPEAETPKVPLTSNPKFVITVLLIAAVAICAALLLT